MEESNLKNQLGEGRGAGASRNSDKSGWGREQEAAAGGGRGRGWGGTDSSSPVDSTFHLLLAPSAQDSEMGD